jgi:superfamily II DNA or RNA helicase
MSLGLYIQMTGRLLRTIGGNIEASIRAGKADGIVLDFAGNIDQHGPLDFIRPKDTSNRAGQCEDAASATARRR